MCPASKVQLPSGRVCSVKAADSLKHWCELCGGCVTYIHHDAWPIGKEALAPFPFFLCQMIMYCSNLCATQSDGAHGNIVHTLATLQLSEHYKNLCSCILIFMQPAQERQTLMEISELPYMDSITGGTCARPSLLPRQLTLDLPQRSDDGAGPVSWHQPDRLQLR